jgi:hypothetical protein
MVREHERPRHTDAVVRNSGFMGPVLDDGVDPVLAVLAHKERRGGICTVHGASQ